MYKVLALVGIAMFVAGNVYATSLRGYWAIGGEAFFLLLPLYVWAFVGMVRDERKEREM